jgi:hypothetical protein
LRAVKTRDTFLSHLKEFPSAYNTKEEYENFLIDTTACVVGLRKAKLANASDSESFQPAHDIISLSINGWNPEFESSNSTKTLQDLTTNINAFIQRLSFAVLGGFALIIPMLIMKLYPTTLTVCLTTALFVIVAALLLALFMQDTEPKDVLGITAAYAAVLVVFVGTSTTSSGLKNRNVAIIMGSVIGCIAVLILLCIVRMKVSLKRRLENLRFEIF